MSTNKKNTRENDLRQQDIQRSDRIENPDRSEHKDRKDQKVSDMPDVGYTDSPSTRNDMSKGDLTNNRTGRTRTATPHSKTYLTGTDDDGQNV